MVIKFWEVLMKESKIEVLLKKREQLEARIKLEQRKDCAKERKDDTRRKILVGAYYLDKHVENNTMDSLISHLSAFLIRPNDRNLFGLEFRQTKTSKTECSLKED